MHTHSQIHPNRPFHTLHHNTTRSPSLALFTRYILCAMLALILCILNSPALLRHFCWFTYYRYQGVTPCPHP